MSSVSLQWIQMMPLTPVTHVIFLNFNILIHGVLIMKIIWNCFSWLTFYPFTLWCLYILFFLWTKTGKHVSLNEKSNLCDNETLLSAIQDIFCDSGVKWVDRRQVRYHEQTDSQIRIHCQGGIHRYEPHQLSLMNTNKSHVWFDERQLHCIVRRIRYEVWLH